jgi:hypothetical protein
LFGDCSLGDCSLWKEGWRTVKSVDTLSILPGWYNSWSNPGAARTIELQAEAISSYLSHSAQVFKRTSLHNFQDQGQFQVAMEKMGLVRIYSQSAMRSVTNTASPKFPVHHRHAPRDLLLYNLNSSLHDFIFSLLHQPLPD